MMVSLSSPTIIEELALHNPGRCLLGCLLNGGYLTYQGMEGGPDRAKRIH